MADKLKRTSEQQERSDEARERYQSRREGRPKQRWVQRPDSTSGAMMPTKEAAR